MANCGTVTVVPAFEESNVSVTCASPPSEVVVGETFTVEYTIVNDNDTDADVEYELLVGSDPVDSGSTTVSDEETLSADVVIDSISGESEDVEVSVELPSVSRA